MLLSEKNAGAKFGNYRVEDRKVLFRHFNKAICANPDKAAGSKAMICAMDEFISDCCFTDREAKPGNERCPIQKLGAFKLQKHYYNKG